MASRLVFLTLISRQTVFSSSTMTDGGDFSTTHLRESDKIQPRVDAQPQQVDGIRQLLDNDGLDPFDLSPLTQNSGKHGSR